MPVNKIIIDNKHTKAERISPEKIQLDLVAIPMDDENDAEPNLNLNLYINGELLKTLQSDENGFVKENLVVNDEGGEQVMIKLEDVISGIQSKIKCVMVFGCDEKNNKKEKVESKDKQEIIELVKKNGRNLSDERCKSYINDFDVVMEAVKQNGLALQFASENLRNNYDIVMEAVKQNGLALKIVPLFKDDLNICVWAVNQNVLAYDLCGEQSILSEELLEIVFKKCLEKKEMLDKLMRLSKLDKKEFGEILFGGDLFKFLGTNHLFIKNDKEVIRLFIKNSLKGNYHYPKILYERMSENFKNDSEIVGDLFGTMIKLYDLAYSSLNQSSSHTHPTLIGIKELLVMLPNALKNNKYLISHILSLIKEIGGFLYSTFISYYLGTIGENLLNDKKFILSLFDNNNGFGKSNFIIASLIKIPQCKFIQDKGFILELIDSSNKSKDGIDSVYDEPYEIYRTLYHNSCSFLQDEAFVLKLFKNMSAKGIFGLTCPQRYYISGSIQPKRYTCETSKKIVAILSKKDRNLASSLRYNFKEIYGYRI